VQGRGSSQHVYAAAMAAYPGKEIHWAINPSEKPTELYEKGTGAPAPEFGRF